MRTEGPPGRVIWEREGYSIWEVDGEGDQVCWGLPEDSLLGFGWLLITRGGNGSFSRRTFRSSPSCSWIIRVCSST